MLVMAPVTGAHCHFENNVATGSGGGLTTIGNAGIATVSDCEFISNHGIGAGSSGGAVAIAAGSSGSEFRRCLFEANSTAGYAGAISVSAFVPNPTGAN